LAKYGRSSGIDTTSGNGDAIEEEDTILKLVHRPQQEIFLSGTLQQCTVRPATPFRSPLSFVLPSSNSPVSLPHHPTRHLNNPTSLDTTPRILHHGELLGYHIQLGPPRWPG